MNWILAQATTQATSATSGSFWMPPQASTVAGGVDSLFYFIFWITVFFFVLILALMLYFVAKYRYTEARPDAEPAPSHSTALELTWTIIPTILVLMIFYFGFRGFLKMSVVPPNAYEINVTAKMWAWEFAYPNGYVDTDLHIPANTPIRIVLQSQDVLHDLYIPQFRTKKDAVPGRYNHLWLQATAATPLGLDGKPDLERAYDIFCAEYCGTSHSSMRAKVIVHDAAKFSTWLADASDPFKTMTPLQVGQMYVTKRGCLQCHTVDGSKLIGPSLKNVFGEEQLLTDGTKVVADENYIKESIYDPAAKIVAGYTPQMPSYKTSFKDRDIDAIITYLKSISDKYKNETLGAATAPATATAPN